MRHRELLRFWLRYKNLIWAVAVAALLAVAYYRLGWG